jgi:hypothetical protein
MLSLFLGGPKAKRTWKGGGHQLLPLANVGDMIDEEKRHQRTHDKEPEHSCRQF